MSKKRETQAEKRARWDREEEEWLARQGKSSTASLPSTKSTSSSGSSGYKSTPRCYESHPPYEIAPGILIYGGSCHYPIVKDADIYGGFDSGMRFQSNSQYPWAKAEGPVEFLFKITDMQAPSDPIEFSRMIGWLSAQLKAGKKVHLGCIGGHGRTGLVFAALRKNLTGDENATQHVRDNYCQKVVESQTQVDWLQKHFGIAPVAPTKAYSYSNSNGSKGTTKSAPAKSGEFQFKEFADPLLDFGRPKSEEKFHADDYGKSKQRSTGLPLYSASSMWGG